MKPRRSALVAAAVLAVVALQGGGGHAASPLSASAPVLVSTPGHRTSEFAAAVDPSNPNHLLAGGIDWDTGSGTWSCAAYVSRDGGATWHSSVVAPLSDFGLQGDPWVSIGPDGTAHYACLHIDRSINLLYERSTDGGGTWSAPVAIAPRAPAHHVDRTGMIAGPGGSVVACTNEYEYDSPNPLDPGLFDGLAVASSSDGGVTWTPTRQLTDTYAACRGGGVGPNGDIYISFIAGSALGSGYQFGTIRSTDGGATWSDPTWIDPIAGDDLKHAYYGGALAVSPTTGSVFVSSPGVKPRLLRSTGAGAYQTVALPDIPTTCTGCTDVIRTVVAANARGDIGVHVEIGDMQQVRDAELQPYPVPVTKEEWLLVSSDDGQTWAPPLRVAAMDVTNSYINPRTFTPTPDDVAGMAAGVAGDPTDYDNDFWNIVGPFQRWDHLVNGGDYTGMTTSGNDFIVMWVAHYNGIPQVWASRVSGGA